MTGGAGDGDRSASRVQASPSLLREHASDFCVCVCKSESVAQSSANGLWSEEEWFGGRDSRSGKGGED